MIPDTMRELTQFAFGSETMNPIGTSAYAEDISAARKATKLLAEMTISDGEVNNCLVTP